MSDHTAEQHPSPDANDEDVPDLLTLFEPITETICDFGDIILVADDGFHPVLKIRVSSCILAMSSKPFRALFSRKFSEGQQAEGRTSKEPAKVEVKDSPTPLKRLCRLLHHQSSFEDDKEKIQELPTRTLVDLAFIADKYDCIEAIRLQTDALLESYVERRSGYGDGLLDFLTATFIFDQPRHFRKLTREVVLTRPPALFRDIDRRCRDLLPDDLFPSILNQQNVARQKFNSELSHFIDDFIQECKSASEDATISELFDELRLRSLWPVGTFSPTLRSVFESIEAVTVPTISVVEKTRRWEAVRTRHLNICEIGCNCEEDVVENRLPQVQQPTDKNLKNIIYKVAELCVGICLDCVRDRECRNPHRRCWNGLSPCVWQSDSEDGGGFVEINETFEFHYEQDHPGYWEDLW